MPQVTFGQLCDTRRNSFDFLRFFFASLVIFSHSYLLLTPDGNEIEPLSRATHMKMNYGSLAVACFRHERVPDHPELAASAACPRLLQEAGATNLSRLDRRPAVLRPGHRARPAAPPRFGHGDPATYRFFDQLLLHNSGINKVLPGVSLPDGSTWTIPFEVICYGLVAVMGLLGLFCRRLLVLALALALLLFISWPTRTLWQTFGPTVFGFRLPYFGWLRCLPLFVTYFLCGALFFLFRDRILHSPWLLAVSAILVGLTLGGLPLAPLFFVVLPMFGFYVLFYLAFLALGGLHAWARRGGLSYGIYRKSRKAPRFIHGDIRLRVFPKARDCSLAFYTKIKV